MNTIDIYVSSSSHGEGFPNVIAEAMACQIPCVTTDIGEAKYVVRTEGWVVPPKSPILLAQALSIAINEMADKTGWQKRKKDCRKIIENNFSLSKMIKEYSIAWSNKI